MMPYSLVLDRIFLLPGEDATFYIHGGFKTHLVQHHASHHAALATTAMNDHLFILQVFEVFDLHRLNFAQRNEFTTEVGLFIFMWLTAIDKVDLFTLIHAL